MSAQPSFQHAKPLVVGSIGKCLMVSGFDPLSQSYLQRNPAGAEETEQLKAGYQFKVSLAGSDGAACVLLSEATLRHCV